MSSSLPFSRLDHWIDPEIVIAGLSGIDICWLDAGPAAAAGWSYVLTGPQETGTSAPGAVRVDRPPRPDGGPPFRGGWVGWLDYERGAHVAGSPVAPSKDEPVWLRVERGLAFDHERGAVWTLGDVTQEWLDAAAPAGSIASVDVESAGIGPPEVRAIARDTPAEYAAMINDCRAAIAAGDAYQLCLTTRFDVPGQHDPLASYLRLRKASPSHHGGYLSIRGTALLSASPERFLHAAGGMIRTDPIKGTRPRSADPRKDKALAIELQTDAKERAENVMIVDLMRNDLSRVCITGSIDVPRLWEVESYPAVHQLVSTITGRIAPDTEVEDVLRATFPAGSMTGAPKLSAMAILHQLERHPRGLFSGCFGFIGVDGTIDLAMVIRTIVITEDSAYVGAGGGITWNSVAEAELREVAIKARGPLAAVGATLPRDWTNIPVSGGLESDQPPCRPIA